MKVDFSREIGMWGDACFSLARFAINNPLQVITAIFATTYSSASAKEHNWPSRHKCNQFFSVLRANPLDETSRADQILMLYQDAWFSDGDGSLFRLADLSAAEDDRKIVLSYMDQNVEIDQMVTHIDAQKVMVHLQAFLSQDRDQVDQAQAQLEHYQLECHFDYTNVANLLSLAYLSYRQGDCQTAFDLCNIIRQLHGKGIFDLNREYVTFRETEGSNSNTYQNHRKEFYTRVGEYTEREQSAYGAVNQLFYDLYKSFEITNNE